MSWAQLKANPNKKMLAGGMLLCILGLVFNGDQLWNGDNVWLSSQMYDTVAYAIGAVTGAVLIFRAKK